MSYILYFQAKSGDRQVTVKEIKEYFQGREDYQVNDYQALYSNEDTGVYFTFEYGGQKETTSANARQILPVYFNIGYSRPHIFVLEAEPELAEFIRHFDLLVSDLHMKGSEYGEYNEMDFYRGWNSGNEANYRNILRQNSNQKVPALPLNLIEKCWRWNYHLKHMQSELGQQIFVPKVYAIKYRDEVSTAVVWTDAIPIALPKVDNVILFRKSLAPRSIMKKNEDMAIVKRTDIDPLLKEYPVAEEHLAYYTVIYIDPPKEIKTFFQSQKTTGKDAVEFISCDQIHDKELVEKAIP
jgi:hypothetical protein